MMPTILGSLFKSHQKQESAEKGKNQQPFNGTAPLSTQWTLSAGFESSRQHLLAPERH